MATFKRPNININSSSTSGSNSHGSAPTIKDAPVENWLIENVNDIKMTMNEYYRTNNPEPEMSINNPSLYSSYSKKNCDFGGDQGELFSDPEKWINDPVVRNIVSSYYTDYTDEDLELLFDRMNRHGCGYIAAINTAMPHFLSMSNDEFKQKYGYDLYSEETNASGGSGSVDGSNNTDVVHKNYNYQYLFLDYFLFYSKRHGYKDISEVYGNIEEEREYSDSGDSALNSNGNKFELTGMGGTSLDSNAEMMKKFICNNECVNPLSLFNQSPFEYYINPKVDVTNDNVNFSASGVNSYGNLANSNEVGDTYGTLLDSGYQVTVSICGSDMYSASDEDGNHVYDDVACSKVGSHALTVVGTTNDPNKIVVSSWGKEYIIDTSSVNRVCVYSYNNS